MNWAIIFTLIVMWTNLSIKRGVFCETTLMENEIDSSTTMETFTDSTEFIDDQLTTQINTEINFSNISSDIFEESSDNRTTNSTEDPTEAVSNQKSTSLLESVTSLSPQKLKVTEKSEMIPNPEPSKKDEKEEQRIEAPQNVENQIEVSENGDTIIEEPNKLKETGTMMEEPNKLKETDTMIEEPNKLKETSQEEVYDEEKIYPQEMQNTYQQEAKPIQTQEEVKPIQIQQEAEMENMYRPKNEYPRGRSADPPIIPMGVEPYVMEIPPGIPLEGQPFPAGLLNEPVTRRPTETPIVMSNFEWPKGEPSSEERRQTCMQYPDPGSCSESESRWYYDERYKQCRWFRYTGCGGNANRFAHRVDCQNYCVLNVRNMCKDSICLYGARCTLAIDQDCIRRYAERTPQMCPPGQPVCTISHRNFQYNFPPALSNTEKMGPEECREEKNPGSCLFKNNKFKPSIKYYYNPVLNDCRMFYYSNCGGGNNRFNDKTSCMNHCGY